MGGGLGDSCGISASGSRRFVRVIRNLSGSRLTGRTLRATGLYFRLAKIEAGGRGGDKGYPRELEETREEIEEQSKSLVGELKKVT